MPLRHLIPYVKSMPHVMAIQSSRLAEAVAVGTGAMTKEARTSVAARWRRDIRRTARKALTPQGAAAAAAAVGIPFRTVTPKPKVTT